MTDVQKLIARLQEQRDRDAAEHCPAEIIVLQHEAISALQQMAAEIERSKQDWDRFHHIMNDHGLHPGRTDDDLLVILEAALSQSQAAPARVVAVSWQQAEKIVDVPQVEEAIGNLLSDQTGDNATALVQVICEALIEIGRKQ